MLFNLVIQVLVKHLVLEIVFVFVFVILVVVVKLLPNSENNKIYDTNKTEMCQIN